ncbi:MAG: response regulator transcription factor [Salinivirgaceae bacterium]|nr:response regulator transcription factor [Salinivirgaceae bacterium]
MNTKSPSSIKPKIIIADDHALFREGIRLLIEVEQVGDVIAEAENGKVLLELLELHSTDMVIMDIDMPIMNGLEASIKALKKYPNLKILIISMHGNNEYFSSFIDAGVKGFILKTADKIELKTAINKIISGDSYFSQELLLTIINNLKNPKQSDKLLLDLDLSDRESETIHLLCKGFSIRDIAAQLFLSPKTVETYRSSLLHKTGSKNTLSLVLYAIKNKIVTDF